MIGSNDPWRLMSGTAAPKSSLEDSVAQLLSLRVCVCIPVSMRAYISAAGRSTRIPYVSLWPSPKHTTSLQQSCVGPLERVSAHFFHT